MFKILLSSFLYFLLVGPFLCGQEVLPDPDDILNDRGEDPVEDETSDSSVKASIGGVEDLAPERLRKVLTERVSALRKLATAKGLNLPHPFKINERERGALIGHKDVEYRYRIEKRKIPRYEYEYEEYEEYVLVPASDDPYEKRMIHKKVKRQRITSRRVIGHDIREVKVPDSEGPLTETYQVPQYESASSAYVHHGAFGSNAMAFLTMLKCGLPADDERLRAGLESLTNALVAYGAPDRTWDLAWLVALYSNLPQENKIYRNWTQKLVGKLIAGANQDGDGAGLWGPNCVNPEYLAAIVRYDQQYRERYLDPIDQDILKETQERRKARLEEKKRALLEIHNKWAFIYHIWGVCGRNIYGPTESFAFPAEVDRQTELMHTASGRLPGLTCDFTVFQMGDLESTAMALFALKEAAVQNCLPSVTPTPYDLKLKPIAKGIQTRPVMERALKALVEACADGNGPSSCTAFNEHKAFSRVELNEPSVRPSDYKDLPSRDHVLYRALGCASLGYVAECLDGFSARRARAVADEILPSVWPQLQKIAANLVVEDLPGRHASLWHFAELSGHGSSEGRRTWEMLALALLERPRNAGAETSAWSRTPSQPPGHATFAGEVEGFFEVSAEEFLLRHHHLTTGKGKTPKVTRIPANGLSWQMGTSGLFYPAEIVSEATTLAFLAAEIRPPAFACWKVEGSGKELPVPVRFVSSVYARLKVNVGAIEVAANLPLGEIINTPFVVLEQVGGKLSIGESATDSLKQYLTVNKGTLLIICNDGDGGKAFWEEVRQLLKKSGITGEEKVTKAKGTSVHRILKAKHPVAICIQSPEDENSARDVARVMDGFLKEKLPPIYFEADYPLMLDQLGD